MFMLYKVQVFSSEIGEIFKNTFENINKFVQHLQTAAPVNCYLLPIESFCQKGDDFFMAVRFIHY